MRSSFSPWDFIKSNPQVRPKSPEGIFAISSYDPYIEKIVIDRFSRSSFGEDLTPILGSDLTIEWIENNLLSLGLFGGGGSYLVLHAEGITSTVCDFMIEKSLAVQGGYLVLCFSKGGPLFETLSKKLPGEYIKINAPKFWEGRKLLDFLSGELRVRLPYNVSTYLLEAVNSEDCSELYHCLNLIKLHFDDQNIDLERVKGIIATSKLDNFKFATLFGQKKFSSFWRELDSLDVTFDQLRIFFSFMEGHLYKMYDTSYAAKKGALSKYDQGIIALSKRWTTDELQFQIRQMAELEVMAKSKDVTLYQNIRLKYIQGI